MRRMRDSALVSMIALALALGGCSDGEDLPMAPQIVPHINPVNFCEVWLGDETYPPQQISFDLMLQNQGRELLTIESFEILHDQRCAFEPPYGDVRIFDEDPNDEFLATARKLDSAFMRMEYSPPGGGLDQVTIRIHSNAENLPELDVYVCGAGQADTTLSCRIRVDPDCSDSELPCNSDCDCFPTEEERQECRDGETVSSEQCIFPDGLGEEGVCACRPCGLPPEEDWPDCSQG